MYYLVSRENLGHLKCFVEPNAVVPLPTENVATFQQQQQQQTKEKSAKKYTLPQTWVEQVASG